MKFKISSIAGRFAAMSANLPKSCNGWSTGGYFTLGPWILILLPMDIIYSLNVKFTTTLQALCNRGQLLGKVTVRD